MDFYHRELETMNRARLREYQDERLRRLLREVAGNPFFREKFQRAGVGLETIGCADGLKRLPFTTKSELSAEQRAYPPYGRLLTYPLASYRYLHQTSGTSGQPLRWLDTADDWETWLRCWSYVFRGAGVNPD